MFSVSRCATGSPISYSIVPSSTTKVSNVSLCECRHGPCPGGRIETNIVVFAAPKIGASFPNGFLVSSRITGISFRAKMMSIAACGVQPRSRAVDIGCSLSKRATRRSRSSRVGV